MTGWGVASAIGATGAIVLFYIIATRARGPLELQVTPPPRLQPGNPRVITRGPFGRASLSNLQLFFYSLKVEIDENLLALIGLS